MNQYHPLVNMTGGTEGKEDENGTGEVQASS